MHQVWYNSRCLHQYQKRRPANHARNSCKTSKWTILTCTIITGPAGASLISSYNMSSLQIEFSPWTTDIREHGILDTCRELASWSWVLDRRLQESRTLSRGFSGGGILGSRARRLKKT